MKKRVLSIVAGVSMLSAICLSAVGCSRNLDPDGYKEVAGKTNISIGTYNGGVGLPWLEEAAKRFEDAYANVSFEDGKTGVALHVMDAKTGVNLEHGSLDRDVFFTESVDYFTFVGQEGKLADISDVVKADLSGLGDSGTIEDKLDPSLVEFLTAKDGKYYALPFYDGIYGILYDVDMFAKKGWFLDESGGFTRTNKSKGIDGVAGTYDDGLPRTYEEFGRLVNKVRTDGVTPFVYAEESMPYFNNLIANFWADYEGKDKMQRNWSLSGEIDIVTGFSGSTPNIGTATVNGESNYTELQKQPGKYYALKFLKDVMMSNGQNYKSATDFQSAQYQFLRSLFADENPVAMIVEGAWFENEAEMSEGYELAAMEDLSYDWSKDYKLTRKVGFMPIPMVDDTASGTHKQTLLSTNESFCFVRGSTTGAKLEVAKEFVKFVHTNSELAAFTAKTSITRPFDYSTESVKNNMSYFGRTLMEIKQSSNIVYPYSNNAYYVAHSEQFKFGEWGWKGHVAGDLVTNAFDYFRMHSDKTAMDYFNGLGK